MMNMIQILFCKNKKHIGDILTENTILVNLLFKNAIKIPELKTETVLQLKSSKSIVPNLLFNGILNLIKVKEPIRIMIGTTGLSFDSIAEIIDYFRFEAKSNNHLIFVLINEKMISNVKLITLSDDDDITYWFTNQKTIEEYLCFLEN